MKQFIVIVCLSMLVVFLVSIIKNIKFTQIVEDFDDSSCKAVSTSKLPSNHPINLKCKSGPYVTNLLETKEDGTKVHRCKSKCAVKSGADIPVVKLRVVAKQKVLHPIIKIKLLLIFWGKSTENLDKAADIGGDLSENGLAKIRL